MSFEERVCALPRTFESTNKSTATLLVDVAHPDALLSLSEDEIFSGLKADPGLVDLWFKRGADQRISGGWGVEGTDGDYRVQSFSSGDSLQFADKTQACAAFVVRYVAHIAKAHTRRH